jgi:hypothetical protein
MNTVPNPADTSFKLPPLSGAHQRTLEAIFRHPSAHNLEWRDLVGLISAIGDVHEKANSDFTFAVAGHHHTLRKPHTKDLAGSEVIEIRHFLKQAGVSPELAPAIAPSSGPVVPSLLVVVDHQGAKIFHIDVTSDDALAHVIRPADPHQFSHHGARENAARDRGHRSPDETAYYEAITNALPGEGQIVVIGHGTGKANVAHHLTDYLQTHHPAVHQRVVQQLTADLSTITDPQLLDLARQTVAA